MRSTTSVWRAFGTLKLTTSRFGLPPGWDTCTLFFASVRTLAAPRICRQCFLSAGRVRSIVTGTFIVMANGQGERVQLHGCAYSQVGNMSSSAKLRAGGGGRAGFAAFHHVQASELLVKARPSPSAAFWQRVWRVLGASMERWRGSGRPALPPATIPTASHPTSLQALITSGIWNPQLRRGQFLTKRLALNVLNCFGFLS
jgi:hypothetical protein